MEGTGDGIHVEEKQVQVRFTTKLSPELRVVNTPFSVPSHLTRYGLSEVINALLGLEKPQPFDCLIDGELLRTSLEHFLILRKLSAETILSIEYIRAVAPPKQHDPLLHPDWVSAVDSSHASFIFTGSYDNLIRAWTVDGSCIHTFEGHTDAITAITAIDLTESNHDNGALVLVSSSKDQTIRIWQFSTTDHSKSSKTVKPISRPVKILKGHGSSVQTIAVKPSRDEICSGSWDCSLKLWKASENLEMEEEPVASKKRRLDRIQVSAGNQETHVEAHATLEGHTQVVAAVAWPENGIIYSASWDHSIRSWDVETAVNITTLTCSKALHCLSIGHETSSLLATGGTDPVLRVWDPRIHVTVGPVLQLSSHKAWITACKWHQQSRYHIISASHDGSVKLWDIRSKVPLYTMDAHQDKVLCADWWSKNCIVSGGADCQLHVFSSLHWLSAGGSDEFC